MRKVSWSAAVSLDLYLAGPEEAMDWLRAELVEARPIAQQCVFLRYRLA